MNSVSSAKRNATGMKETLFSVLSKKTAISPERTSENRLPTTSISKLSGFDERSFNSRKIILEKKGYKIVTGIVKADKFWQAEEYHQDYYQNNGKRPYCHSRTKRF